MKKLMKISAFLLALVMCVTSVIPAYAAEKTENGVTLTMTMDKQITVKRKPLLQPLR